MGGRPQIEGVQEAPTIEFDDGGQVIVGSVRSTETAATVTTPLPPRGLGAGMAIADVVAFLGEPDIVTRGPAGREIWMWDGVSPARLDPSVGGPGLLAGADISRTGGKSGDALTVVVRFDELLQVTSVSLLACRG